MSYYPMFSLQFLLIDVRAKYNSWLGLFTTLKTEELAGICFMYFWGRVIKMLSVLLFAYLLFCDLVSLNCHHCGS